VTTCRRPHQSGLFAAGLPRSGLDAHRSEISQPGAVFGELVRARSKATASVMRSSVCKPPLYQGGQAQPRYRFCPLAATDLIKNICNDVPRSRSCYSLVLFQVCPSPLQSVKVKMAASVLLGAPHSLLSERWALQERIGVYRHAAPHPRSWWSAQPRR